jgi:DTW domain-containing protein YfiP
MRSRTLSDLPGRCRNCWLKEAFCLCAQLPRVETRFRLVVIRHVREGYKSTNTARMALLAMPNAELVAYEHHTPDVEARLAGYPGAWLLFPPDLPGEASAQPAGEPQTLVVLDGTWRQVRKMINRSAALRAMPRLALPAPEVAPQRLRFHPREESLCTLEAIAAAVGCLQGTEGKLALEGLHSLFLNRTLVGRGALPRSRLMSGEAA